MKHTICVTTCFGKRWGCVEASRDQGQATREAKRLAVMPGDGHGVPSWGPVPTPKVTLHGVFVSLDSVT